MPDDTFRLFPGDKQPSPGDAVVQFLLDEQKKGNKRAKAVGNFLTGPIFGRDPKAHEAEQVKKQKILDAAESNRKQILIDLFGIDPDRKMTPGEAALGFGAASIKGITGVPGLGIRLANRNATGEIKKVGTSSFPVKDVNKGDFLVKALDRIRSVKGTGQENLPFASAKEGQLVPSPKELRNIGGIKPSTEVLEAKALEAQTKKRIQAQVKVMQKNLDALLIEEVNPLAPTNLVKELAAKGMRAKAGFNEEQETHFVSFKSAEATRDELVEFGIVDTASGPVLAVNFNSPTLKPELRQVFKQNWFSKFLDDFIEPEAAPGQLQRMSGETSEKAPLPSNFSFYSVKDFDEGLQLINRMLDIVNEN